MITRRTLFRWMAAVGLGKLLPVGTIAAVAVSRLAKPKLPGIKNHPIPSTVSCDSCPYNGNTKREDGTYLCPAYNMTADGSCYLQKTLVNVPDLSTTSGWYEAMTKVAAVWIPSMLLELQMRRACGQDCSVVHEQLAVLYGNMYRATSLADYQRITKAQAMLRFATGVHAG